MTTVFLCLNQTLTFRASSKILENIAYKWQDLSVYGEEVLLVPNFISQKYKVSPGIHPNKWKHKVCNIKLVTEVVRLHKIPV